MNFIQDMQSVTFLKIAALPQVFFYHILRIVSKGFRSFVKFHSISTGHSIPFKFMHVFIQQMKDADFWPNNSWTRGNAVDTANSCQMITLPHVEKDLNSNEHFNLNSE